MFLFAVKNGQPVFDVHLLVCICAYAILDATLRHGCLYLRRLITFDFDAGTTCSECSMEADYDRMKKAHKSFICMCMGITIYKRMYSQCFKRENSYLIVIIVNEHVQSFDHCYMSDRGDQSR